MTVVFWFVGHLTIRVLTKYQAAVHHCVHHCFVDHISLIVELLTVMSFTSHYSFEEKGEKEKRKVAEEEKGAAVVDCGGHQVCRILR